MLNIVEIVIKFFFIIVQCKLPQFSSKDDDRSYYRFLRFLRLLFSKFLRSLFPLEKYIPLKNSISRFLKFYFLTSTAYLYYIKKKEETFFINPKFIHVTLLNRIKKFLINFSFTRISMVTWHYIHPLSLPWIMNLNFDKVKEISFHLLLLKSSETRSSSSLSAPIHKSRSMEKNSGDLWTIIAHVPWNRMFRIGRSNHRGPTPSQWDLERRGFSRYRNADSYILTKLRYDHLSPCWRE